MKKSTIVTIGGLVLGLAVIGSVFVGIQGKNKGNSQQSEISGNNSQESESPWETETWFETEDVFGTETWFETETVFETESVFETEEDLETEGEVVTEELSESEIESESESNKESERTEVSESEVISESQVPESEEKKPASSSKPESQKVEYPYYIRVNRQANCVTVYTKDENGNYSVPIKAMACSVGLTGNTPLGVSKISDKYNWRLLFGNVYGQYSVRFNGHILFHSVPYTSKAKDTLKEGEYNLLGQPASQGCVRLSCEDAKWIYDNCRKGTRVEVYDSADPGPLGKPQTAKISYYSPYKGWDPTDPDPRNPWKSGEVSIYGVKDTITVNQGDMIDLLAGVSATDIDGLSLMVDVIGTVDMNTPGMYDISYVAESVIGVQKHVSATVVVNAVELPETEQPEIGTDSEMTEAPEIGTDSEMTEAPEIGTDSEMTEMPEIGTDSEMTEMPEVGTDSEMTEMPEVGTDSEMTEMPEVGTDSEMTEMPEVATETESMEETEVPKPEINTDALEEWENTIQNNGI